jgi:hypothetical protein
MAGGIGNGSQSPVITTINVNAGKNAVAISWNTDKMTSGLAYYSTSTISVKEAGTGSDVQVSGTSFLANTDLRNVHQATIGSLQSNTTYYYVLYTRDASGNVTVTWPSTFHTSI